MAGHVMAKFLLKHGHIVRGFARQKGIVCQTIVGDAANKQDVVKVLKSDTYDVVVNCLGVLNQAVDSKLSEGIYVNSVLPHFLAENVGSAKLIHISTDCVFDGEKGQYIESDIPNARSMYGRSKALGEINDVVNLTIRTSIVGPELKDNGIGLFHWFMHQDNVKGYSKVKWSGVTTLELAKAVELLSQANLTGLYHLVNNETITKFELLQLFNCYCRRKKAIIIPDDTIVNDKSLIDTRRKLPVKIPSYEDMVKEMGEWIAQNKEFYRQYQI